MRWLIRLEEKAGVVGSSSWRAGLSWPSGSLLSSPMTPHLLPVLLSLPLFLHTSPDRQVRDESRGMSRAEGVRLVN